MGLAGSELDCTQTAPTENAGANGAKAIIFNGLRARINSPKIFLKLWLQGAGWEHAALTVSAAQ
jgi:hypothetical protein